MHFQPTKQLVIGIVMCLLCINTVRISAANSIFQVTVDTTSLTGTMANLAFDLLDGDGTVNNTVTISNFSTDGSLGLFTPSGGVTGALPGTTTLDDTSFFNEVLQEITLGSTISFTLAMTQNFAGGPTPDALAFFLLDASGLSSLVTTTDPTGANALFAADLNTGTGNLQVFTALVSVTPVSTIPEPGTGWLLITGILGLAAVSQRRRIIRGP